MKSETEWVFDTTGDGILKYFKAVQPHPSDYDPTSEELMALIRAVQLDTMESMANVCREFIGDYDHPGRAQGAAECMIAIRKRADALRETP